MPKISALYDATFFAGLRKAGVPETNTRPSSAPRAIWKGSAEGEACLISGFCSSGRDFAPPPRGACSIDLFDGSTCARLVPSRTSPGIGHQFAGKQVEQVLAGAVGADDAEPVATHDPRRKISSHGSPR